VKGGAVAAQLGDFAKRSNRYGSRRFEAQAAVQWSTVPLTAPMCSPAEFAAPSTAFSRGCRIVSKAFFAAALSAMVFAANAKAQDADQPPPGTVARVEGPEVSVDSGTALLGTTPSIPSVYLTNGSIVTVHAGRARMLLLAGGQVDICGPAKLTLLYSAGAVTLALNFGRIHVQLPSTATLRIFTPTIIATPLEISGGTRDITAGLDLNDSLCVRATSGALRLEQQFTGEDLIVPQAGEFFLANGKLIPVAGAPGSCQCEALHVQSAPPPQIPVMGISGRQNLAPTPEPPVTEASATPPPAFPIAQPNVQLRALELNNDAHPVTQPAKSEPPTPPAVPTLATTMPDYKVIMPPLAFSPADPEAPDDSAGDVALIVRTVHVEPEWQFSGHVAAPSFDDAKTPAKQVASAAQPAQNKESFWTKLKRAFGGKD
jgi:hypothetical protein